MAATLYAGTGASNALTNTVNGVSFQPDFVWIKTRTNTYNHALFDSVRGVNKQIASNATDAEVTQTQGLMSFNSNGFTLGTSSDSTVNNAGSGQTYVGWQWNAGGSTVTNTSGSISAQVRANTTAGFSVVTYTGTGSAATVGHGLGVAPSMVIVKSRSAASTNWVTYHTSSGATKYILLNTTGASVTDSTPWNNTAPTSALFSLGTSSNTNGNTSTFVAYCFAAVAGYSAFGSYTGNGSADGPFVYLGFRPRYLLIKSVVVAGGTWVVFDSARSTYNVTGEKLAPNTADSENSGATGIAGGVDFLSNGFKIRLSWGDINTSNTLIYAAFAENPFKYANAR